MKNSENDLAAICQRLDDQEQELNKLRKALAGLGSNGRSNGSSVLASGARTDRRGMLKTMAGLAVGVATAGLLRPSASEAGTVKRNGVRNAGRQISGARVKNPNSPNIDGDPWLVGDVNNNATLTTGLFNTLFDLAPVQLQLDNIGTDFFVPPANTDIGLVAHIDTNGANTFQGTQVAVWAEAGNENGGRAIAVYGHGTSEGGHFVGDDAGVVVQANRVTLCLFSTTEVYPPTSPTGHAIGEIVVDQDYTMWYSIGAGAPAPFRRLAGPTSVIATGNEQMLETAGALSGFLVPPRFVDTRAGSGNTYAGQTLLAGTTATYQIAGVTVNGNTVPTGATAILARIADANPTVSTIGRLYLGAMNPPPLGMAGVLPVLPNIPTNTLFFSMLDSNGNLYVRNGSPDGSVDLIIDIDAYYL